MEEDEIQNTQKNVEKDLFDEQSKILDRFYSLITLTFTAFGFSITALSFIYGRGIPNVQEALRAYHIGFSFFCMFLAFLISIINVLAIFHHRKLVKKDYMIGYREDNELINNNLERIVTTGEELEGYYIIKAILRESLDLKRIAIRDKKSYCGVLLDDNNRKPVCRMYFNTKQKYLGLFTGDKDEEKVPIEDLNCIYNYADKLKNTVNSYDNGK